MRFAEAWRVALDALRANRLRSGLTMLGVVIGVAAVVVLVAIGTGAKQEVESQVQGLGSNLLLVVPGKVSFGNAPTVSPMSMADIEAVSRVAGGRERVAATLSSGEKPMRAPPTRCAKRSMVSVSWAPACSQMRCMVLVA